MTHIIQRHNETVRIHRRQLQEVSEEARAKTAETAQQLLRLPHTDIGLEKLLRGDHGDLVDEDGHGEAPSRAQVLQYSRRKPSTPRLQIKPGQLAERVQRIAADEARRRVRDRALLDGTGPNEMVDQRLHEQQHRALPRPPPLGR